MQCKCGKEMEHFDSYDTNNGTDLLRIFNCNCGRMCEEYIKYYYYDKMKETPVYDWYEPVEKQCECTEWTFDQETGVYFNKKARNIFDRGFPLGSKYCSLCGGRLEDIDGIQD